MGRAYHACVEPWENEDWTDFYYVLGFFVWEWTGKCFLGYGVDSMRMVMDELDGV